MNRPFQSSLDRDELSVFQEKRIFLAFRRILQQAEKAVNVY